MKRKINFQVKNKEINERFKYNLEFENAMIQLLGQKYSGYASAAEIPKYVKKGVLEFITKAKERIDQITTMDERLRLLLFLHLNHMKNEIKNIQKENNDWIIISILLNIIAVLLGYDWREGKVHRHVVYFRDKNQEIEDYQKSRGIFGDKIEKEMTKEIKERYKIVHSLYGNNIPRNLIARIMNISEFAVAQILRDEIIGKILQFRKEGLKDREIASKLGLNEFDLSFAIKGPQIDKKRIIKYSPGK